MDKKRSFLNVAVSLFFRIIILSGNLLVRRLLIRYVGNEANGLNSLYSNILGVLAFAELGIGEAIVFCMYKPIVERDTVNVAALYNLFRRIYFVIGMIIALAGCGILPFLPYFVGEYAGLDINLYLTFALMLASVVLTYFYSAKSSLMNAYRDNYISTTINSCGQLLQQMLQIIVILFTRSFTGYLICHVVAVLVQWAATEVAARKKYILVLKKPEAKVDANIKEKVVRNVKAMLMHRIGNTIVYSTDNIIISAVVGVLIVGKFSNYMAIMTAVTGTLQLFFSPLTSTMGHLYARDKKAFERYYNFCNTLNYVLGCIFFLGYYGVVDDLLVFLFDVGLELDRTIVYIITLNNFIQFMRRATLMFRDAAGLFYYDRWKAFAEGIFNLVLSIAFARIFERIMGNEFAVAGVLVATIVTNIFICHVVEPYVLYKHGFHTSVKKFYLRNYGRMAVFAMLLWLSDRFMLALDNRWFRLAANGCIAVCLSIIPVMMAVLQDGDFRHYAVEILRTVNLKFRSMFGSHQLHK